MARVIDLPPGQPGELVVLAAQPRLYLVDGFAAEQEIAHVLTVAADEPALIEQGISIRHSNAGRNFEMPVYGDPVIEELAARIYEVVRMDNEFGETMRFRHYHAGDYHPLHTDAYSAGEVELIVTAMLYLTDTTAGGETHFPAAVPEPILVRPRAGRLVIWFSHLPEGVQDPTAVHEGLAVREGEKATLTNFIYKPLSYCQTRLEP